jgi:hypothetical protein
MSEYIKYKNEIIAFIVRNEKISKQTNFFSSSKNSLQFGHIVKKIGEKIPRHKHKRVKRIVYGTPEILIVKRGLTTVTLYVKGKKIKSITLKKGDVISLIDCEHSFYFNKNTVLQEIKQGPYIKKEKVIYD